MIRAAWKGFGLILPVLLGVAYGSSVTTGSPALAWPSSILYAAFTVVFAEALRSAADREHPSVRGVVLSVAAGVPGPVALGAHWALTGHWLPFAAGTVGTLLVAGAWWTSLRATAAPAAGNSLVAAAADVALWTLLLALAAPLVGAFAAGLRPAAFPWLLPVALLPSSVMHVLCGRPGPETQADWTPRRARLVSSGLVLLAFVGVCLAAWLMPATAELRLLAVSAPAVALVTTVAALLHPDAGRGLALTRTVARCVHLLILAGFSILYALT